MSVLGPSSNAATSVSVVIAFALSACASNEVVEGISAAPDPREPPLSPWDSPPFGSLRVVELQVEGVTDPGGRLEIELHLFDAHSGAFLGCSGALQGLLSIDASGTLYAPDAHFVKPSGVIGYPSPRSRWLYEFELRGKPLELVAIEEEDDAPCPAALSTADEVIGESEVLSGDDLRSLGTLQLGQVSHLKLGVFSAALAEDRAGSLD